MDWTQIIIAVVGLIGVVDLGRVIFFRASKRKANAEATSIEKQNEGTAVEALKSSVELLSEQLRQSTAKVSEKQAVIDDLREQVQTLQLRLVSLYDDMCIHKGCKLRKPHEGQGKLWYDQHADDPSLGCDYLSVEWMLKNWRQNNPHIEKEPHGNDQ